MKFLFQKFAFPRFWAFHEFFYYKIWSHTVVFNDVKCKSREQRLITKEHIATCINLTFQFKTAFYFSTLAIKPFNVALSQNSYCKTISQSSFISFATHTVNPFLKVKHFVLLVIMYSWKNMANTTLPYSSLAVTHDALHH